MCYKHELLQQTEIVSWRIDLWRRRNGKICHSKWWKLFIGVRHNSYLFWL